MVSFFVCLLFIYYFLHKYQSLPISFLAPYRHQNLMYPPSLVTNVDTSRFLPVARPFKNKTLSTGAVWLKYCNRNVKFWFHNGYMNFMNTATVKEYLCNGPNSCFFVFCLHLLMKCLQKHASNSVLSLIKYV